MFHGVIHKIILAQFFWDTVYNLRTCPLLCTAPSRRRVEHFTSVFTVYNSWAMVIADRDWRLAFVAPLPADWLRHSKVVHGAATTLTVCLPNLTACPVYEWMNVIKKLNDLNLRSLLTLTLTWVIWLTDNSLQSADKDQQEMRAVAEKPHVAVSKCTAASRGHPCDSVASCFNCCNNNAPISMCYVRDCWRPAL